MTDYRKMAQDALKLAEKFRNQGNESAAKSFEVLAARYERMAHLELLENK